jgi:hypothetical protein
LLVCKKFKKKIEIKTGHLITKKTVIMQKRFLSMLVLLLASLTLTSCEVVEGIFKAGMGVGIFIVIAVIAVIVFIISKLGGRK